MTTNDMIPHPQFSIDQRLSRYISLRWKLLAPLAFLAILLGILLTYILMVSQSTGIDISEQNILEQNQQAVTERTQEWYQQTRSQILGLTHIRIVQNAVLGRQIQQANLIDRLREAAQNTSFEHIILTNLQGEEILSLMRDGVSSESEFSPISELNWNPEELLTQFSASEDVFTRSAFLQVNGETLLYSGMPIAVGENWLGFIFVGQSVETVIDALSVSNVSPLVLFDLNGTAWQSSDNTTFQQANFDIDILTNSSQEITIATISIDNNAYHIAYSPLAINGQVVGSFATYMPANSGSIQAMGQQLSAIAITIVAGITMIAIILVVTILVVRVNKVTDVAEALVAGERSARTNLQPTDEIGKLGYALDRFATITQAREDYLTDVLRHRRRELSYLMAVFESIPKGIIVQEMDGRVLFMNKQAQELLGTLREFRSSGLSELSQNVSGILGETPTPGLYTLGQPQDIEIGDRMVQAQVAVIQSVADQRIGTVILLEDMTETVQQQQHQEDLLQQLTQDVQQPLTKLLRVSRRDPNRLIGDFSKGLARHSASLQKMIVQMREITQAQTPTEALNVRPLHLETLLWAVANDWRQIAQVAGLKMHTIFSVKNVHILGDEHRLRWAIGNLVDNAIKYTPAGGALTLEIQGEQDGMVHIRVRDNGVGISREDLNHILTPFYRGTPITKEGEIIRVPGMGQGLKSAQQIFDAHNAKMKVKSQAGVGTAVYVALPVTASETVELPYFDDDVMEGETVLLDSNIVIE